MWKSKFGRPTLRLRDGVEVHEKPHRWLVYSSAVTARPVLCAAAYLVVGPGDATINDDDAQDRAWMVERMEKAGLLFDDAGLDHLDSEPPDVVAQTFAEVTRVMDDQGWLHELVRDVHEDRRAAVMARVRRKRDEIQSRPPARRPKPFAGCELQTDDGGNLLVNDHVRQRCSTALTPCAVATAVVIRRPTNYSCPCAVGVVFACRRHPTTSDIAQSSRLARVCRASDAAASVLMAQTEETTRVELPRSLGGGRGRVVQWDPSVVGGNSYRVLVDGRSVPVLVRRSEAKRITGGDPFDLPGFGVATLSYENAEGRIWDVKAGAAWAAADVYPRVKIKCRAMFSGSARWRGVFGSPTRRRRRDGVGSMAWRFTKVSTQYFHTQVYPIAAWAFKARPEDERRITGEHGQLRAPLKRPVALRGLVVGLLQAEDRMREFRDAHPEPNLDLQFVGVEGYAYP